jgi:hypothetical protein
MRAGPYHWPTPPIGPSAWLRPCLIHLLLGGAMKSRLCLRWLPALLLAACAGQDSAGPSLRPAGSLEIAVTGLPDTIAAIVVTGPMGFTRAVTATTTLSGLADGAYTITASNVMASNVTYIPAVSSISLNVEAGRQTVAAVNYRLPSGTSTGSWNFTMRASGPAGVCSLIGSITVFQFEPDSELTGRGVEYGPCPSPFRVQWGVPITGSAVDGTIRIRVEPCSYVGAFGPGRTDSMGGSVSCTIQTPIGTRPGCVGNRCGITRTDHFTGTWYSTKALGPVASLRGRSLPPPILPRSRDPESSPTAPPPGTSTRRRGSRGW